MKKNLYAEIISIGNEILAGYTINTNSAFISQELREIGIAVNWVTTIADDSDEIFKALQTAAQRADVIAVTGGLGPTPDDITKELICRFFDTKLVENADVLNDLKDFLKKRKRPAHFLAINRAQALVPENAKILRNAFGTAPGIIMEKDNSVFVFMPGVPLEMKNMFNPGFINFLKSRLDLPEIHTHIMRTTGIAESSLHDMLKPVISEYPQFPFAFLPRQVGVDLRFRIINGTAEEISNWQQMLSAIRNVAQKFIFTENDDALEEIIFKKLFDLKQTIAVAESFTGGLLQDWITNVPGSSSVYLGGIVAYSNQSKIMLLDVKGAVLKEFGAVSSETAIEMVRGVQKKFSSHCAIATTGIAGPTGGSNEKPVGLCYIAVRYGEKESVKEFNFGSSREINKMRGAMSGLEILRRLIDEQ
ncbi:MAG: competence/damage-inducible protein A [Calditrichaeota bacterium]|nr:competence/damage-inducible protein A [Calditrichota bacterium]